VFNKNFLVQNEMEPKHIFPMAYESSILP